MVLPFFLIVFFFSAPATTEIYTLSLHDALPICVFPVSRGARDPTADVTVAEDQIGGHDLERLDRKSTRLNSSHRCISYAVFCLKKKKKKKKVIRKQKHS